MTQFGTNLGPICKWVVHNIQTGPQGCEGMMWGCQVDLTDGQPHTGIAVHYAGDGGQINIEAPTGNHYLVKQFLNDCEDCLRTVFPDKQPTEDRYAAAEGILALACDECPAGYLTPDRIRETLTYLVSDKPPRQVVTKGTLPTPELDKLAAERPKTEAIQAFLEYMHEKGYQLKKTIPSGWCRGDERIPDVEFEKRYPNLVRLPDRLLSKIGRECSRICVNDAVYSAVDAAEKGADLKSVTELVDEYGWVWDRGFELDDIGFEGQSLDRYLYEFIEVDPQKIDDERRALLENMG